jgi:hypothetical protein
LEEIKMKKTLLMVTALAITATSALAGATRAPDGRFILPKEAYQIVPLDAAGNPIPDGGRANPGFTNDVGQYNNLQLGVAGATSYFVDNAPKMVIDDYHMGRKATDMTGFIWVYTDGGKNAGPFTSMNYRSHDSTVALFTNTANDNSALNLMQMQVTFTTLTSTFQTMVTTLTTTVGASILITGLPEATIGNPAGGWGIRVTKLDGVGFNILSTSAHGWMGIWSQSLTPWNAAPPAAGSPAPGLRGGIRATQFNPHIGDSHDNVFATATTFGSSFLDLNGVNDSDNIRWAVVPEPGVAGLLALSGLLVLRRRRA